MNYFNSDYLDFFKELAANNNKEWFDANRTRYEKSVKQPFEAFVTEVIKSIQAHDPAIAITHKDAIFRINKDVRFSKDKDPYKLNRSAIIAPNGKKDKSFPGLYFEMGPEHFRIYGGVYMPDKFQLYDIRAAIAENPTTFNQLTQEKSFISTFGEIHGEKNKIIPKEFIAAGASIPLIYNKQFYWFKEFSAETILDKNLLDILLKTYLANKKQMDFFAKVLVK